MQRGSKRGAPPITLSQGSHRWQFLLPTTLCGNTHPSCQPRDLAWALVLRVLLELSHTRLTWLTFSLHSLPEAVLKRCGPKPSDKHTLLSGRNFQRASGHLPGAESKGRPLLGKVNSSPHTSWQSLLYYFFYLPLGVWIITLPTLFKFFIVVRNAKNLPS